MEESTKGRGCPGWFASCELATSRGIAGTDTSIHPLGPTPRPCALFNICDPCHSIAHLRHEVVVEPISDIWRAFKTLLLTKLTI
jgi:hypothetical protein